MSRVLRLPALLTALALSAFTISCGGGGAIESCTTSTDCPSPQTCVSGTCVNSSCGVGAPTCSVDDDCRANQHCASGCCVAGVAGTCTTNSDCSSEARTPVCNPLNGSCVQCVANRDCGTGFTCTGNLCVGTGGCFANSDCTSAADPVCNVNTRTCVQCVASSDCPTAADPVCNANHLCVSAAGCSSNSDCTAPTAVCSTGGECVQCASSNDCAAGLTCSVSHTCVQPSATTCNPNSDAGTDSDCASSPSAPHCLPISAGSSSGTCVACVTDEECPPADVCSTSNLCTPLRCAGNSDCANPAAPVCNTGATPPGCVACLQSSDCPNGGTCQGDHTCQAPTTVCTDDSGCASNTADPHCAILGGTANKCVACRFAGQCGTATCPNDCGTGQTCTTGNVCINVTCTSDAQCTDPRFPHCDGSTSRAGSCVECVTAGQCPAGDRCDSDESCVPVCTTATQAADCPTNTPLCKVSPAGNSCVQCISDASCSGSTSVCSSSNTCIAPPPTGCTTNSDCPAGQHVCDTATSPHSCVQCLATSDCASGDICNTATDTCEAAPEGSEGQSCFTNQTCNDGLLCIDEGGANPVCRLQCDPTDDTVCRGVSSLDVCEWLSFDDNGTLIGICEPGNGNGQTGAACDPAQIDSCEWNLLCASTSSSGGVCSALCVPGGDCDTGACNTILGAVDADGNSDYFGYCGSDFSNWGATCVSDSSSGGPDCGDDLSAAGSGVGLFCVASTLPAEYPPVNIVATCQYGPKGNAATGGAGDSCSALGGADCRTGLCLSDGPQTCFDGCQYNADCGRDGTGSTDCFAVTYSSGDATGTVGTCEPTCRDDLDCPAGSCQPAPVFGGTSWHAICAPVSGAGKAGSACSGGAACESGVCLTASSLETIELGVTASGLTATDGFCVGACLPSGNDCATGTSCSTTAALPLAPTSTGDLGVSGKVNPGVCFGTACTTNASCTGDSKDSSEPRVCSPYKTTTLASDDTAKACTTDAQCSGSTSWVATCNSTANNPNPGSAYGSKAGIFGPNGHCRAIAWSLGCAPTLGASKGAPGASCSSSTDCQTGHCISNGTSSYCFGGCSSNSDCSGGTTCEVGTYLGLAGKHCQP